jgi:hypothetical protein
VAHVPFAETHEEMMFIHLNDEECGKGFGIEKYPAFVFFRKFEE